MQRSTKISEGLQCSKMALVKIEVNLSSHSKIALVKIEVNLSRHSKMALVKIEVNLSKA